MALQLCQALERCKEGKIGFGSGYNIQTSILQAIYDCPFLSAGVEVMMMLIYLIGKKFKSELGVSSAAGSS